jgi:hypothetical protein
MTEMTLFRDRDVTTLMMALTQHFRADLRDADILPRKRGDSPSAL